MKRITLTQGMRAIVDDADFEYLSQWTWYYGADGYAVRNSKTADKDSSKTILMHRVINKTPMAQITDHINCDKLDNRKSNLRSCTKQQNQLNRGKQKNNTSGYKGVSWNKANKKWQARICIDRASRSLGYFKSPLQAHLAYSQATAYFHKEFAHA